MRPLARRLWLVSRPAVALALMLPTSLALGVTTGLAGRVVQLLGFYEVLAALVLSVASVAVAHVLRWKPGGGGLALALAVAVTWLAAHRLTDAWGFRAEQAQAVVREAESLAEDFLISGADTPLQLVDLGLRAETGAEGLRGALMVQWRAGPLVLRAVGLERRLPAGTLPQALLAAATVTFLTLLVRRALRHLAAEPQCAACRRFLRRERLGRVAPEIAADLKRLWLAGNAATPLPEPLADGPEVYREVCSAGHTSRPGYALVQFRRHSLGSGGAAVLARWPAHAVQATR